jgi:hypothetical protein
MANPVGVAAFNGTALAVVTGTQDRLFSFRLGWFQCRFSSPNPLTETRQPSSICV